MTSPTDADAAIRARREGQSKPGTIRLHDFDQGVIETLGTYKDLEHKCYALMVEEVKGRVWRGRAKGRKGRDGHLSPPIAPGTETDEMPGVPVFFSHPEDVFAKYDLPLVFIRRDDLSPATSRWHPGSKQYRAAAEVGLPAYVTVDGSGRSGFDRMEQMEQAVPYDITYTLSILARMRGKGGSLTQTNQANAILDAVLRVYQPYSLVKVFDSLGDGRTYEAFVESISHLDEVAEVADRVIGFAVTLRVEAELDLHDPQVSRTVTQLPTTTFEGM